MRAASFFAVILIVGAVLSAAVSAHGHPYVDRISVRNGAAIEIEIHTTGPVAIPNTQVMTAPDRIVVDFPGALPAAGLRALKVNRGPLKGIRSALFFDNPPITRIVLDLTSAQAYQISQIPNGVVVRLIGTTVAASVPSTSAASGPPTSPWTPMVSPKIAQAHLTSFSRVAARPAPGGTTSATPEPATAVVPPTVPAPPPEAPKPVVNVSFHDGMLQIHAEKATLADVLSEVQRQTKAEIDIPAGAEQEQVVAELGPAPVRDVLAALLNGSNYNFIVVGDEQGGSLRKVILSRRGPSP